MQVKYVSRTQMPEGHTWAIVTESGETTAYVLDSVAERVALAVYSSSKSPPNLLSA